MKKLDFITLLGLFFLAISIILTIVNLFANLRGLGIGVTLITCTTAGYFGYLIYDLHKTKK